MDINRTQVRKKLLHRMGYIVIASLILLTVTVYLLMDKLLFPYSGMESILPRRSPYADLKASSGNITLLSGDAVLDALWLKAKNPKGTVLYSHGNGETLNEIRNWLKKFPLHGYNIFAYDYAGYGGSTGKAGEKQACKDIEAAYRFLTENEKIPAEQITVAGFSVGTGPGTYLATEYPVRNLVLVAPFASAAQAVLPFPLPLDRFRSAGRLSRSTVPVLIIHGKDDRIIPFRNGKKIYEKAAGKKKFIPVDNAKHNDLLFLLGDQFWEELDRFNTETGSL